MESTSTREHNHLDSLPSPGVIFIFLGYAILRLWQVYRLIPFATKWVDSGSYLFVARQPFLSPQFLAGSRPLTIPLVFKLAGLDPVAIAWWQGCISIISWGFLIYQAIMVIENRTIRWLGLACLMLFSLVYNISGWDIQLMSESLAISFQMLLVGCFLWLLRKWSWYKLIPLVLAAFLWTSTRDSNPWMLVVFGAVIVPFALTRKTYRRFLVLPVIFMGIILLNQFSLNYSQRWLATFLNVLPQRILVNKNALQFFEGCGMPVSDDLLKLAGPKFLQNLAVFRKDPGLAEVNAWILARGKYCFIRWLVHDPVWALTSPMVDWGDMLNFDPINRYDYFPRELPTLLPRPVEYFLYPARFGVWVWWLGTLLVGLMAGAALFRNNPAGVTVIILFLLVTPFTLLNWNTDTRELARHALQGQVLMFFCLWILLFYALDAIFARFRPGRDGITGKSLPAG